MNMKVISDNASPAPSTPSDFGEPARPASSTVRRIYDQLALKPDLSPCQEVDSLFSALVDIALATPEYVVDVLQDPRVAPITPQLRRLCSIGECALEHAWARRIIESSAPRLEASRFPYATNYRRLCRMEIGVLASALPAHLRKVGFDAAGRSSPRTECARHAHAAISGDSR